MARVTSGVFTPVRHPKDMRAIFEEVSFSDIEKLEVRNKTRGQVAENLITNPDGSFSALVSVAEGENVLEVYARSTDGTESRREVPVKFLAGARPAELSPRLLAQRNRLLENRLLDLQRRRVEIQAAQDEEVRREIKVEIEKEREKARAASEERRKEIQLSVEREAREAEAAKKSSAPAP